MESKMSLASSRCYARNHLGFGDSQASVYVHQASNVASVATRSAWDYSAAPSSANFAFRARWNHCFATLSPFCGHLSCCCACRRAWPISAFRESYTYWRTENILRWVPWLQRHFILLLFDIGKNILLIASPYARSHSLFKRADLEETSNALLRRFRNDLR